MDDILKRMLLVEEQADEIVAAAEREAEQILTASRQQINDEKVQAQQALAKEYEALLSARLTTARSERDKALAEADKRHAIELKAFHQSLDRRLREVKEALAYPSDK
ncbi:MAG: hypothetical protein GX617_14375 [Lentisphaerae bacterium]|nr:hypothetical protein [Lentisphaerota bacterium]